MSMPDHGWRAEYTDLEWAYSPGAMREWYAFQIRYHIDPGFNTASQQWVTNHEADSEVSFESAMTYVRTAKATRRPTGSVYTYRLHHVISGQVVML